MTSQLGSRASLRASMRIWWYHADNFAIFHMILTPAINFGILFAVMALTWDSGLAEGVLEAMFMTATILMGLVFISGLLTLKSDMYRAQLPYSDDPHFTVYVKEVTRFIDECGENGRMPGAVRVAMIALG